MPARLAVALSAMLCLTIVVVDQLLVESMMLLILDPAGWVAAAPGQSLGDASGAVLHGMGFAVS